MASKRFEELALAKNPLYQRIIDIKARKAEEEAKKTEQVKSAKLESVKVEDGYYYNYKGKFLGKEGDKDKVYVVTDTTIKENKDGTKTTIFNNPVDLEVTHTEFREQAATIYGESSAYKLKEVTNDLINEMFAIASVYQKNKKAYGANSVKAKEYLAQTPSKINDSLFKTTANAAVINALIDGIDYSNEATNWDGREQGLFPASNNNKSVIYNKQSFDLHMNTMGWNISDDHYNTWKNNIGEEFKAPQQKKATVGANSGKIRYQSTAVYLETIFWKVI